MADLIGAANAIKVTSARKIMVVTKGNDGRTAYVHFKFSAVYPSADSDLKDTPDTYIGVCSDFSEKAPTAFTAYTWYIWKGDVGRTPVTLHGTAITGTGNSISAEIAGALIGDFYINSDTCNMYTCVAVNTWNYVTCVKGDPGGAVAHASSHAVGGTDPVTITLPGQATGMLDALHGGTGVDDVAKIVPAFTPSTSFAAPASGDTLSTLFAKIAPWTTDSGKLSVSGSFATGTLSYQKIGKLVEIYFSSVYQMKYILPKYKFRPDVKFDLDRIIPSDAK